MIASFDLAFPYVDLGDPWWRTAVTEMLRSARRVMPEARIVQLTDAKSRLHPWAHTELRANVECKPEILSQFKGYMVAHHAQMADRPVIFCDADMIWVAPPPLQDRGWTGVEPEVTALPYRQFLMQTNPTTDWAWDGVQALLDELPATTWAASAAELALNYSILKHLALPVTYRAEATDQWARHFPGPQNREAMIAFARSLDGGEPFKQMDPGHTPQPTGGVNEVLDAISFDIPHDDTKPQAAE